MKIDFRSEGFEEILRSQEVASLVTTAGERLAAAAGRGYKASFQQGKTRFRGIVFAGDSNAYRDQLRNNTLQKVLFAGGGG